MFKKSFVYIVLFSMALHCGCRLGFLDHLYQKRHEIAYTIGLITEVPMAMCSSDYDLDRGIKVETIETEGRIPVSLLTHELDVFCIPCVQLPHRDLVLFEEHHDSYIDTFYQSLRFPIFHPPSFS
jgi:hypothetical protein